MTLAFTAPRAADARSKAATAQARLREVARDAGVINALRSEVPDAPESDQSRGGLTPRVTTVLQQAGLPANVLASLSPEAESAIATQGGVRVSRRRATLTLAGVTLPQVGRFLEAWRTSEPAWTPTNIDLSPVGAGGKPLETGGDLPLRAVIAIETSVALQNGDQR
jgi:hypothetical protein